MRKPLYLCTVLIGAALIFSFSAGTRNTRSVSAAPAGNGDYVLTAGQWTAQQDVAVQQAGGTVIYKHGKAGFATVTSDNPNFLDQVMATGVISSGAADEVVQWQGPANEVMLDEQAVTPGNDGFINAQWNIKAIDAAGAWNAGYDGTGVRVAILDGGIRNTTSTSLAESTTPPRSRLCQGLLSIRMWELSGMARTWLALSRLTITLPARLELLQVPRLSASRSCTTGQAPSAR